jgi:hypothetical protein
VYNKEWLDKILQEYFDEKLLPKLEKEVETEEDLEKEVLSIFRESIPDDFAQEIFHYLSWSFNENDTNEYWFKKRLEFRWQEAIFLLKSSIELSFQLIKHQKESIDEIGVHDLKSMLIIRLHWKAVLISREILLLIENWYWEWANARWRSLYENCVVTTFLSEQGLEVAQRYLDHESVRHYNYVMKHKECSGKLWHETYTEEDIEIYKWHSEEVIEKYGSKFKMQYGWIPEWVIKTKNKWRIGFEDIERHVELSHFNVYHYDSNESIHSWIKSLENIWLRDTFSLIMTWPSNYWLANPIQNTELILKRITAAVYVELDKRIDNLKNKIPWVLLFQIYTTITSDIWVVAVAIQKGIEEEELSKSKANEE